MGVKYTLFDNELVSKEWATVLHDMREDGVGFTVGEGHRTMERQRYFYNCMLTKLCNNGNLAAFPSPNAPHIRTGRIDHALDVSNPEPVMRWLEKHQLRPSRPAGAGTSRWEPWHIECPADRLEDYHREHDKDIYDTLPKHVEEAVRKLLYHRHQAIEEAKTGKGKQYDRHVRWRKYWRHKVEEMMKRSKRPRTKKILRALLDVDK